MAEVGPRALRVLHVMECTIGGARRHITDVARGLRKSGIDVHLAVAAERQLDFRETLSELEAEGCGVHEIPMRRSISPLTDARQVGQLARLLRSIRPDVVHTHSSKAGVLGRLASLRTGIGKRVHTPHTFAFLFREMFGPLKRGLIYRLEKKLAARTHGLIAVSPSEANTIASSGIVPPEKIHVVPNGIEPGPFMTARPVELSQFGLDPSRPTAAVVGLLNVAKGQDLALRALSEEHAPDELQLLIVGHGEDRARLEALARELDLARRVAFLGYRDDVPGLLAASDLLLLPSRWEGMPYTVIEAMAAGLPVVATPVDGAVDLVVHGETGRLARESSSSAIATALADLMALSPAKREELGAAGRRRALESFTSENMVAALVDLYECMLDQRVP